MSKAFAPPLQTIMPRPATAAGHWPLRQVATTGALALFFFVTCGPGETDGLHINGAGKAFWALADAATFVAVLAGHRMLMRHLWENWVLLAWPALAMLSCLWSLAPFVSAYHGLQLLMTLAIGYLIAASADLRRILLCLTLALGMAGLASLALLKVSPGVAIGDDGTWIGVFTHKNQLGGFMVLLLITATALFMDGRYRWLSVSVMPLALLLLVGSRSGTSFLALAAALSPMPLAWAYRKGVGALGIFFGMGLCGVALGLAMTLGQGVSVVDGVLGGLGKDSTLTGRTILWQFGLNQIGQTPLIGVGYKAYWEAGGVTSVSYLRYVIGQDLWFFHNNFIDVGVAFGALGLTVFAIGLIFAFRRTLALFLKQPTALQMWRLMFMIFVTVEATAENPLFQNHSLLQLLMAIAVARPILASRPPVPAGPYYEDDFWAERRR